jgi:glutamate-ammonia-ligase adenylyltransferase
VRQGNTFDAIEALRDAALIHPYGAERLHDAYSFLRRMENMIQAEDDLQQHKLPDDAAAQAALARKLGFHDDDPSQAVFRMMEELRRHRHGTRRLFTALFEADYERLELMDAIRDNAARAADEEEEIESLAWFKTQEMRRIRQRDLAGDMELRRILRRLTLTAEAVLSCTLEMATKHLEARFGIPRLPSGERAGFAVVGLGSLGAEELDYPSDLDLCFLYAGAGTTDGEKSISNVEYFTKLAQRIISTISLHGRYGHAYKVDSELRPSGRSGTLVATLDAFRDYHLKEAEIWERLSLMKARPITGDGDFMKSVKEGIGELAFGLPAPPEDAVRSEIIRIRDKTIAERTGTRPEVLNLKIGRGGLADIESVVQLKQLLGAQTHRELWCQNTFEIFEALGETALMDPAETSALREHLAFLRRLLSRLRLTIERSTDEIRTDAWYMDQLAFQMGLQSGLDLSLAVEQRMAEVAGIFEMEIG